MLTRFVSLVVVALGLSLAGCSDNNSSSNNVAPAPPPPPNTMDVDVELTSVEVVGGGAGTGSATASFTVNLDDNTISGTVTLTGLSADAVNVNQGFAGENGTILIALNEDSATEWFAPPTRLRISICTVFTCWHVGHSCGRKWARARFRT